MRTSRRAMLAGSASLVALSGAGVAVAWWWSWRGWSADDSPMVDGQPLLRMPFAAGTVVLCQQGNYQPAGRTHAAGNCLHALDFSNSSLPTVDVVAAAPGEVGFVFDSAVPGDVDAGQRFGNHVAVVHRGGYFSLYAHLDETSVKVGQRVITGAKLGTMGMTGAAGNRHLHFALHQGEPRGPGAPDTVPMAALVAVDLSTGAGFRRIPSADFVSGEDHMWQGDLYGSETDASRPSFEGASSEPLGAELAASHERLRRKIEDRLALMRFKDQWQAHSLAWAESELKPILERDPEDALARYWRAVAVQLPSGEFVQGLEALERLLAAGARLPTWELWLVSAIHIHLGERAYDQQRLELAEQHFLAAVRYATQIGTRRHALGYLERIRAARDARGVERAAPSASVR